MSFNRFNAERGGIVTLQATFSKVVDNVSTPTDPYSQNSMYLNIYESTGTNLISGLYNGSPTVIALSGLPVTRDSAGVYSYDFQTLSGMNVGTYVDSWRNVQYVAGDTPINLDFAFTIRYNDEDLSDWDVVPG